MVNEPSVKYVLVKCCDHSVGPYSPTGTFGGKGSGLGMRIIGSRSIFSMWKGKDLFAALSWS